jgi:predicted DCC family thiol-disulfide oxidoreductase YuxK
MSHHSHPILFFDGLCGLCDHLIQFLLARDSGGKIHFVALQSDLARSLLEKHGVSPDEIKELSTVYLLANGRVYRRSRAVFRVLGYLPAPWSFLKSLLLIPAWVADPLYRLVARIRYRIFGRLEQCRIPTPEEKQRFLG